ncbi:protein-arginine deiminase family protein [Nocardioides sp. zg-DK7169]|uniref:protein-arginine deiminase family protein n=1 Tax=Nocardioides sp. zg-DK7169 TaxID=2736600 RepID=UPI0015574639|nr:protein-arginine deiminase family protein [Nocardioides sp. zg-DK7169]NPC96727.1 hypothetical protein [Nocardioides sp. zg-DK7169]
MTRRNPELRTRMRRAGAVVISGTVLGAGVLSAMAIAPASASPGTSALILADTNRDGVVDSADAEGRGTWTKERGAFFLPNLDDDLDECPTVGPGGVQLTDVQLASCNDAADAIVNGDADVLDLVRVQVLPVDTGKVTSVRVELRGVGASKVNVFVKNGDGSSAEDWTPLPANGVLPADRIGAGVELGVEGKDIIRDESWDGTVTLQVVHRNGARQVATDRVELRAAPLLFATDRMPIETLYMADNTTSVYEGQEVGEPPAATIRAQGNAEALTRDFLAGMERIGADVKLEKLPSLQGARGGGDGTDIWTQDIMEPGLMSVPSPDGEHQMRVFVRAPVRDGRDNSGVNPFRQTGRVVFTELRGPDVAGIQHFDPAYVPPSIPGMSYDSRGSTGNYGTVPAYEHEGKSYPLGRKIVGAVPGTVYTADPAFNTMLELQGFQDPINVDTSWLSVGHMDEFMSVIPADNERGWAVVVADPVLALDLLKELVDAGRGDEQLYTSYGLVPAAGSTAPDLTVAQAVTDTQILSGVKIGHAGVNRGIKVLKKEIGLTEDDFIRVPVLYRDNGHGRVGVQIPNAANLIGTGHDVVFIPTQHVPAVDGKDLFQSVIEERFAEVGTEIQWAEDYFYTNRGGQIHCVTNALRDTTYGDAWWSEGAVADGEPGDPEFAIIAQPSVSGTLKAGRSITVHPGTLSPTPTTVGYQWYVGSKPIPGATSRTLKLKAAWAGKEIRVAIVSSKEGVASLSTITSVGDLPRSFAVTKRPSVTGAAKVGRVLTARPGSLKPAATTVGYRWFVGDTAVSGKARLKVAKRWVGKKVTVVVTAKRDGFATHKTTVTVGKVRR